MQFLIGILLAVIQGLTEFIPVSSSGHLAVTQYLLKFQEPPVAFDVVLHIGTLVAVIIYYKTDLLAMLKSVGHPSELLKPQWNTESPVKLLYLLIIASIPTALIGFLLKSRIEAAFSDMKNLAAGFIINGFLLIIPFKPGANRRGLDRMTVLDALVIGTMQGISIYPSISRSGATISSALMLGLMPALAARFSFLLSIPAILGAVILEIPAIRHQVQTPSALLFYALCGVISGIIGYLSIKPLIRILQSFRLYYFAIYCFLVGIALVVYIWLKG
jgi:undecaprenyl-diphosphatase